MTRNYDKNNNNIVFELNIEKIADYSSAGYNHCSIGIYCGYGDHESMDGVTRAHGQIPMLLNGEKCDVHPTCFRQFHEEDWEKKVKPVHNITFEDCKVYKMIMATGEIRVVQEHKVDWWVEQNLRPDICSYHYIEFGSQKYVKNWLPKKDWDI